MLSMQKELAKDNKSMDYSRTMEKMDAIAQNSPILEKTGIAVKDCYRDFVGKLPAPEKVMDKKLEKAAPEKTKSEFAKRLEETEMAGARYRRSPEHQEQRHCTEQSYTQHPSQLSHRHEWYTGGESLVGILEYH